MAARIIYLEARLHKDRQTNSSPFIEFFRKWFGDFCEFGGVSYDGFEFQEWGEETGLLVQEPYDPDKHGEDVEAERGDLIYVLSPMAKQALTTRTDKGSENE